MGANFPKWIIEEYLLDKKLIYFEDWEDNLLMLRYDDEVLIRNYNE
jgi:carbamoyl-phosphate synthase large subunit